MNKNWEDFKYIETMAKVNIVAALNQLQAELPTEREIAQLKKLSHPYYGLKDSRGWLTRYPHTEENPLKLTRDWVKTFLADGGKLDASEVWGASPYSECALKPAKAAEFLLAAHCQRWDNIPMWELDTIVVSETCTLQDFIQLCKGLQVSRWLADFGIETGLSLFSLARKSINWFTKQIEDNFSFTEKFISWGKRNAKTPTATSSVEFNKFCADLGRHKAKPNKSPKPKVFTVQTLRVLKHIAAKNKGYMFFKGVTYHTSFNNTNVGCVYYTTRHLVVKTPTGVQSTTSRQVGEYSVAVLCHVTFAWETSRGFSSHIEAGNVRAAISALVSRKAESAEKDKALTGVMSLRTFRKLTNSCLEGTKSFLVNEAKHLFNLLAGFSSWEQVLASEVADLEWLVTSEFMAKISHRF